MAFKATNKEEDDSLDEDELSLITRIIVDNYKRFVNQRWRKTNYSKRKQNVNYNKNKGTFYNYVKYGHISYHYPEAKRVPSMGCLKYFSC